MTATLSEKFTPRASTSERSKRLRASSLSKCRRTSPLSRTSLSGLGRLSSSSSEGDGDEVLTVAVCGFDKYSSSLMQKCVSLGSLTRRQRGLEFHISLALDPSPVEHKPMLGKDSTWYRTYQIKQARILFTLGHWFTNLEGTARFASYQDCFSMASKSGALGVCLCLRSEIRSRLGTQETYLGRPLLRGAITAHKHVVRLVAKRICCLC